MSQPQSSSSALAYAEEHADHHHHDVSHEHHHGDGPVPLYDRGLAFDVGTLLGRRQMLGLVAAAGLIPIAGRLGSLSASAAPMSPRAEALAAACTDIPEETAGPFPADGSNGPNVLDDVGIVRRGVRSSFGGLHGTAEGIQLQIKLTVLDLAHGCRPYEGAAVYIWHCDRDGLYSLYSGGATDQNYLRGVQEADASGQVTFKSIFPGCYAGRWPHIHFEVYPDVDEATSFRNKIATSQLALPKKVCQKVYATDGYEQSIVNLSHVSLKGDMVFQDGWKDEMAKMTGNVTKGYAASLKLAV